MPPVRTLTAIYALFLLAIRSRFRLRGAYWRWREETAFGTDPTRHPPFRERMRMILEYGHWVHQMRKFMR